jgi:Predicted pPIWI-associating nuclease
MNESIVALLSEGFERQLYAAALRNLVDRDNKLRLNNFAYAMRELMRHVLHRLAPTDSVIQCAWYKNETDCPNHVTRRQRAYFAVQGGLSDSYVKDILALETASIHRALVNAIDDLSKFTHVEETVFGIDSADVDARVSETEEVVAALCSTIQKCRRQILDSLWEQIDVTVVDASLRETMLSIDEIASHHSIEEVYTDRVEITHITHDEIVFKATGSITAELQWSSNSDVDRGDGAVGSESFPFTCFLCSPVDDPAQVEAHEEGLLIDTSSWWNGYYDEEA